ncbi:hypothetical protein MAPG_07847 [Magnaporthiopsis poae ATCC 64411]|uniref:Uncharacterized protein n=1 Tax=Magnaporthiopsis poae (strain ATCC 64411 / 73-15) TaxID=644358 RepID=A0A0C4E5S3_MAGP6|nr:hypothetical protein MAPG_07847 [Magnaporthiopsis poae ATCC 64411]
MTMLPHPADRHKLGLATFFTATAAAEVGGDDPIFYGVNRNDLFLAKCDRIRGITTRITGHGRKVTAACVYVESAPTTFHQHTCVRRSWRPQTHTQTHTHAGGGGGCQSLHSVHLLCCARPKETAAGSTVSNLVYLGPCPGPRVCVHPPRTISDMGPLGYAAGDSLWSGCSVFCHLASPHWVREEERTAQRGENTHSETRGTEKRTRQTHRGRTAQVNR